LEASLASREGHYLILDAERMTLTLKTRGVMIREFPVSELGFRSRRWLPGGPSGPAVVDTTWEGGVLLPEVHRTRTVILADTVTPPDPSGSVAFLPPTPEEEVPMPPAFRLRFGGGLSLRIEESVQDQEEGGSEARPVEEGRTRAKHTPALLAWIRMRPWQLDRFTVRASLPAPEAGALYRSLPEGTTLMVVPPLPERGDADGPGESSP
jgi:hypothetical protein